MQDGSDIVKDLKRDLTDIIGLGSQIWKRQERSRQVRFNEWPGQSIDGRKHADDLGVEALPFEGASDARIPLADGIINDKVAFAVQAFFRAQVQAVPVEPGDAPRAQATTTLLRWLRDRVLRAELQTEVELSAQFLYGDDPGVTIVEVQWWQDTMLRRRPLTFDEVAALYATGAAAPDQITPDDARLEAEMLADFSDLVFNDSRAQEFVAWLGSAFPGVQPAALKRATRELRKTGSTELPVPEIRSNRPCVQALRLFDDFFVPIGTADLQRARSVHRREWLSEVELRERVVTMGWDSEWVDEVIDRAQGQTLVGGQAAPVYRNDSVALSAPGFVVNEQDHLYEIWWSYERRADDYGIAAIYCTIWNGSVKGSGKHEIIDYPHGLYPFVWRSRERVGRQLTDSRGLTRPIETHQNELKVQRDARSNYTQLSTTPPKKVKQQRGAWELIIAPGGEIPVQRMDDFEYLQPPPFPQASIEMERTTRAEADDYTGRMVANADPNRVAAIQQHEIDNFFALWREVFTQVLALCQHYYTPAELARVTNTAGESADLGPDDISGGFDVFIEIDSRDLNMEYAMKKLDAYSKLIALDAGGVLDKGPLVEWTAGAIDPILARRTVRPMENATAEQVNDERNNVAQMSTGIEPAMPTKGINPQLRMQTLVETISQSPKLAAQYAADEQFRALVDNRQKYLTQQLTQERNKVVGYLGTAPLQPGAMPAA
jgi:hypothetical protein